MNKIGPQSAQLIRYIEETEDFSVAPILADSLEDEGFIPKIYNVEELYYINFCSPKELYKHLRKYKEECSKFVKSCYYLSALIKIINNG